MQVVEVVAFMVNKHPQIEEFLLMAEQAVAEMAHLLTGEFMLETQFQTPEVVVVVAQAIQTATPTILAGSVAHRQATVDQEW
jgi:hypothetical protein